jgi:hypothetical protein
MSLGTTVAFANAHWRQEWKRGYLGQRAVPFSYTLAFMCEGEIDKYAASYQTHYSLLR